MSKTETVLAIARESGFDLAGVAPFGPPRRAAEFRRWIASGRHGEMAYLEREVERVADPRRTFPEGRSLLIVGFGHSRAPFGLPDGGRIARYAAGRDYHNVMVKRLRRLAGRLRREGLNGESFQSVDAGPVMERSHAAEGGVGFESKAANLLHPTFGPWFFLGELMLDVELDPTAPLAGSCGTCTACLDACPTGAIVAPGEVDARRCISYLTIEHRSPIPAEHRTAIGDWVFGCDICSEVCPWSRRAPDLAARLGTHPTLSEVPLVDWIRRISAGELELRGSPLQRAGLVGLQRNVATVLGNRPSDAGRSALLEALDASAHPRVREAVGWALAHAHGADADVRAALERAIRHANSAQDRIELERWRDECR